MMHIQWLTVHWSANSGQQMGDQMWAAQKIRANSWESVLFNWFEIFIPVILDFSLSIIIYLLPN